MTITKDELHIALALVLGASYKQLQDIHIALPRIIQIAATELFTYPPEDDGKKLAAEVIRQACINLNEKGTIT